MWWKLIGWVIAAGFWAWIIYGFWGDEPAKQAVGILGFIAALVWWFGSEILKEVRTAREGIWKILAGWRPGRD
jgi:hypothetical protein